MSGMSCQPYRAGESYMAGAVIEDIGETNWRAQLLDETRANFAYPPAKVAPVPAREHGKLFEVLFISCNPRIPEENCVVSNLDEVREKLGEPVRKSTVCGDDGGDSTGMCMWSKDTTGLSVGNGEMPRLNERATVFMGSTVYGDAIVMMSTQDDMIRDDYNSQLKNKKVGGNMEVPSAGQVEMFSHDTDELASGYLCGIQKYPAIPLDVWAQIKRDVPKLAYRPLSKPQVKGGGNTYDLVKLYREVGRQFKESQRGKSRHKDAFIDAIIPDGSLVAMSHKIYLDDVVRWLKKADKIVRVYELARRMRNVLEGSPIHVAPASIHKRMKKSTKTPGRNVPGHAHHFDLLATTDTDPQSSVPSWKSDSGRGGKPAVAKKQGLTMNSPAYKPKPAWSRLKAKTTVLTMVGSMAEKSQTGGKLNSQSNSWTELFDKAETQSIRDGRGGAARSVKRIPSSARLISSSQTKSSSC